MTPTKLSGKEFQKLALYRLKWEHGKGRVSAGSYGVKVNHVKDQATGQVVLTPMKSLPDIEGVLPGGSQFIFDCKVVSVSAFEVRESHSSASQHNHLMERAEFGVATFFLIHFNERHLKRSVQPAATYAFPVRPDHPFWNVEPKPRSINRQAAAEYGIQVFWNVPPRCKKLSPDLMPAIYALSGRHLRQALSLVMGHGTFDQGMVMLRSLAGLEPHQLELFTPGPPLVLPKKETAPRDTSAFYVD